MAARAVRQVVVRRTGALLRLAVLPATPAFAQSGASTCLRGRVADASGAAIPGVAVTLTSLDTASERMATTDPHADLPEPGARHRRGELRADHAHPRRIRVIQLGLKFRF